MRFRFALIALALLAGCRRNPAPVTPTSAPSVSTTPAPAVSTTPAPEETGMLTGAQEADVQLDKEVYLPGEQIKVIAVATGVTESAWAGVVPAKVPHGKESENDAANLGYFHLYREQRPILIAPREPGDYEVRLNDDDTDGREVASRAFKVEADPAPVTTGKIDWTPEGPLAPAQKLEIPFEAPLDWDKTAWIGIIPADIEHGSEEIADQNDLGYEHTDGRSRGTVLLTAPAQPGTFNIRMFDSDNGGKEVNSVTFTVSGS